MIAAYDAQFATPEPETEGTPSETPAQDAGSGEGEAKPEGEGTTEEKKPEGEETPAPATLADLVDSGDFFAGLGGETVPENLTAALVAAGLKAEQVPAINERLKQLLKAEQTLQVQSLHKLAGGEAEFNALNAWAQKALTPEQRDFYNGELAGPNAADVIELLKAKAARGSDPKLVQGNGGVQPSTQGYRSQAEMQRDMRDPRYQSDPAFRAEVRNKLKYATY